MAKNSGRANRRYLRSIFSTRVSPRKRNRRQRRGRRSANFWYMETEITYNKIVIRDVERIWLMAHQPETKIQKIKIPNHENMPKYQEGKWDGTAFRLTFASKEKAMDFRLNFWSQKIL